MRILLVEDEHYLAEAIGHLLKKRGYGVDIALDGEVGLEYARSNVYGAIILDNMLPKLSGISILQALRREQHTVPILMLSAKSDTVDKVEGLENGADDYLAKPFKTDELMARLHAITRRHMHRNDEHVTAGDITLNASTLSVACSKRSVALTTKEYDLLDLLAMQSGACVHTETLFHRAWGADAFVEPRYVSVYMSYLRSKLREIGSVGHIKAVRGLGYQFIPGESANVS